MAELAFARSEESEIITMESPIRSSACMILPSGRLSCHHGLLCLGRRLQQDPTHPMVFVSFTPLFVESVTVSSPRQRVRRRARDGFRVIFLLGTMGKLRRHDRLAVLAKSTRGATAVVPAGGPASRRLSLT